VLLKESSIVSWASIVTFDYRCIIALQDASQATTTLANGKLVYVFEANHARSNSKKTMPKTYNSGYSLVVTHLTTNPPVRCLNRAERTGSLIVSCSTTTKTVKIPVYGITRTEHRLYQ
jgi:hypothetical protein